MGFVVRRVKAEAPRRMSFYIFILVYIIAITCIDIHSCQDLILSEYATEEISELPNLAPSSAGAQRKIDKGLEDLLHWAIRNSNSSKLNSTASKYATKGITIQETLGKEFIDEFFKKDSDILKDLLGNLTERLNDQSEDWLAQTNLVEAVENIIAQVDAAVDFFKLGGIQLLFDVARNDTKHETLRLGALKALATACQNNADLQTQIYKAGMIPKLADSLREECGTSDRLQSPVCDKFIFFTSTLVRSAPPKVQLEVDCNQIFDILTYPLMDICMSPGIDERTRRTSDRILKLFEAVFTQNTKLTYLLNQKYSRFIPELLVCLEPFGLPTDASVSQSLKLLLLMQFGKSF